MYWTISPVVLATPLSKPIFYDMQHSNNAARIRLWRSLKVGMDDAIERRVVAYPDLKSPEFAAINPLKKVPAFIRADGTCVFESAVILDYLEDLYADAAPSFKPPTAEGRQLMQLFIRIHDLYIASPNCCAPGFSHSQGAMYLSNGWHGAARGMDLKTREAKIGEIWRQLTWLEAQVSAVHAAEGGTNLLGPLLTLADFTWFPTCVFMEFMLPRVFGWADPFQVGDATPFPSLARWYTSLREEHAPFAQTHADIWSYWVELEEKGQFVPIKDEIAAAAAAGEAHKWTFGVPTTVALNYQEPPPPGKTTGRYIDQPDRGDVVDEMAPADVKMRDARELEPAATLESMGFELRSCPTAVTNFRDDDEVTKVYYDEIIDLIKQASGAKRVCIFDSTVRESGNTNLNAQKGGAAAPVPRVHCDYTADGAPRRLAQLAKQGVFSRIRNRDLTEEEVGQLAAGRYAFINVWRSIDPDSPVLQKPLAVLDEKSVDQANDQFVYELRFPDRTGENYSLKKSEKHRWFYYPKMESDECLIFKVFDNKKSGPRFVFHTAFDLPDTPPDAPPRRSIEVRAIAFYSEIAE